MPLTNLEEYRTEVVRLVRDGGAVLEQADYYAHLEDAVARLSRVVPRRVVADLPGTGSFDLDLPAAFDREFSRVLLVEYPAGQREPLYIDRLDWSLYEDPDGVLLRLERDVPQVGETVRVTFTAMHELTADSTTVPASRADAVKYIAAGLACEALASHYSNAGDGLIQADSADHQSKAREYAGRAKRLLTLADQVLPAELGEPGPASQDVAIGEHRNHLTHPNR